MRIGTVLLVLSLVVWLPVRAATAYTVTLNDYDTSFLETRANDLAGADSFEIVNPAALPYLDSSSSISGGASAESDYDLANAGFAITFDHSRVNATNSFAFSQGQIFFRVDEEVGYTATGSYAGVGPDSHRFDLHVYLFDFTLFSYVFQSEQQSRSTPDESFTLGLAEGDFSNIDTGSLTGTLIPGHDYLFFYSAIIQTDPASSAGGTASGDASLSFDPISMPAVPLLNPICIAMLCGLIGLGGLRRLRD